VAEWLVETGLDTSALPPEYRPPSTSGIGFSRPELQSVLSKTDRAATLADHYLDPSRRYWHDVLRTHDDPWALSDCPVGASLEHELWDAWLRAYHGGDYETCVSRARTRRTTLETAYGTVPWTTLWTQAIDIAELAAELDEWTERSDTNDVVELYGDIENGTWQIDNAVFNLITSGTPEERLPEEHPATVSLGDLRSSLTESGTSTTSRNSARSLPTRSLRGPPSSESHTLTSSSPRSKTTSRAGRASRYSSSTRSDSTSPTSSRPLFAVSFRASKSARTPGSGRSRPTLRSGRPRSPREANSASVSVSKAATSSRSETV